MNNIKTGGGVPDYIPPDEILDRVASLLGSTVDGFVVEFGGDAEPQEFKILGTDGEIADGDSGGPSDARAVIDLTDLPLKSVENIVPTDKDGVLGEEMVVNQPTLTPIKPKLTLGAPRASGYKRKYKMNESQAARNTAIAEYFMAKKIIAEAKLENITLQNEKLKLEIKALKQLNP